MEQEAENSGAEEEARKTQSEGSEIALSKPKIPRVVKQRNKKKKKEEAQFEDEIIKSEKKSILKIMEAIPNISKLQPFENGLRLIMSEEAAQVLEKEWDKDIPYGCRFIKSDINGFYRAVGYGYLELMLLKGKEYSQSFLEMYLFAYNS